MFCHVLAVLEVLGRSRFIEPSCLGCDCIGSGNVFLSQEIESLKRAEMQTFSAACAKDMLLVGTGIRKWPGSGYCLESVMPEKKHLSFTISLQKNHKLTRNERGQGF